MHQNSNEQKSMSIYVLFTQVSEILIGLQQYNNFALHTSIALPLS